MAQTPDGETATGVGPYVYYGLIALVVGAVVTILVMRRSGDPDSLDRPMGLVIGEAVQCSILPREANDLRTQWSNIILEEGLAAGQSIDQIGARREAFRLAIEAGQAHGVDGVNRDALYCKKRGRTIERDLTSFRATVQAGRPAAQK